MSKISRHGFSTRILGRTAGARRPSFAVALMAATLAGALPSLAQTPTPRPPAPAQLPARAPAPAPARTPAAPPTATNPAAPNPQMDAARAAFEALPLAERIEIQDGLVWTGDYSGALDGTFGRMTFESLTAFQTRHKFTPDGILTAPARKALAEVATTKKTEVGFQQVLDGATGMRIHLPTRLLGPAIRREGGARRVGRGGLIQIDTYALPPGDLAPIFERMKAETPGRKVVYSVLRPDWFVVSDEGGGRHGYARFVRGAEGIRGFVFSLDASVGAELDRVVIATAGRFDPFAVAPGTMPTPLPGPGTPATPTVTTTPAAPTAPAAPTQPAAPASIAASASGLVVATGRAVTAASAVAGCRAVTVGGKPATVTTADASGVATLSFTGGTGGAIRLGEPADGRATVVASGESGGRPGVVATAGDTVEGRLRAALQRGGHGAPVIDGHGGVIGLVAVRPDESRTIAGLIPQARYDLTPTAALKAAIEAAGGTVETAPATEEATTGRVVAAFAPRIAAIGCSR